MGYKIVQTQVLFAFKARDSYLFVFVRTVTVMRMMVFHVLFVSLTSLMVCQEKIVFWVDCDQCGVLFFVWVHNYCAFGKNNVTCTFLCESCLNS